MFIGREAQLEELSGLWGRDSGVLVTCRGRRRIGKSTLIEEFAARTADNFISIDGLAPRKRMSDDVQRKHFCEKIAEYGERPCLTAENWSLAFRQLDEIIPANGRTVVLLDEISWLGGYNPDFPGYFKEAWDKRLRKHKNLLFVLCGSVSSWIAENILNSTGFVGRDSLDLELRELPPCDCVKIMGPSAERLSTREIFDLLSVTGGVPKYVEEIRPELTSDENIRRLGFLPRGLLFRDFDETFNSVFGAKVKSRGRLLRLLASGPKTLAELAAAEGRDSNGGYAEVMRDLVYAGFVTNDGGLNPRTGQMGRETRYRIKDNYIRFYLHFIEPRRKAISDGLFEFSSLEQLNGWEGELGFQFENLVLNHVNLLFPKLGLERSLVLSAAPFVQRKTQRADGCQIDLLIQTKKTLFVVEIKRRRQIRHSIIAEVQAKVDALAHASGLSVRTALVYDGELAPSVPADRYFDFIVSAEEMLLHT